MGSGIAAGRARVSAPGYNGLALALCRRGDPDEWRDRSRCGVTRGGWERSLDFARDDMLLGWLHRVGDGIAQTDEGGEGRVICERSGVATALRRRGGRDEWRGRSR